MLCCCGGGISVVGRKERGTIEEKINWRFPIAHEERVKSIIILHKSNK